MNVPWDISARKKLIHAMPRNTNRPIDRAMVVGCAISATRNYLKLHEPRTLNPLCFATFMPERESCGSVLRCGCRVSTRCWAPVHAGMHVVSNCRRAYHRERRGRAISIVIVARRCRTSRDFVPWRCSAAGRLSTSRDRHPGGRKPAQNRK